MSAYRESDTCPRCGSPAVTSDGDCRACGHVWGEAHRCGHCGQIQRAGYAGGHVLVCAGCGLPRVARGWRMPARTAKSLREAVRTKRRRAVIAWIAFGTAMLLMPFGLAALLSDQLAGWAMVLALWFFAVWGAATARSSGRRAFASAIEDAKAVYAQEVALAAEPMTHVRVDPGVAADEGAEDEEARTDPARERRAREDLRR